jgi:outer membrane murein-binding lipoprotein Lpp
MLLKKIIITVVCLATSATYQHLNALHTDALEKRTAQEAITKERIALTDVQAKQTQAAQAEAQVQWFQTLTPEQQGEIIALMNTVINN